MNKSNNSIKNNDQKSISIWLYIILIVLNLLVVLFLIDRTDSMKNYAQQVQQAAWTVNIANQIDRRIDALAQTSKNLSGNRSIAAFFKGKNTDMEEMQIVLETTRSVLGVQFSYLMDTTGTVVHSTQFEGENPILGHNFSFRPYFQQAMQGKDELYPAVGLRTGTRGLYFASPVKDEDRVIGVAVIKMSMQDIDALLSSKPEALALVTNEGIVFSSNQDDWKLRSIGQSVEKRLQEVRLSRQFADNDLAALPFEVIPGNTVIDENSYHIHEEIITTADHEVWRLASLTQLNNDFPLPPEQANTFKGLYGTLIFFDLLIIFLIVNIDRRKRTEIDLRHHQENLETIVDERTVQLKKRNDFIRSTFGRYISHDIVDNLLSAEGTLNTKGEKRVISILMTDIRGFSTLSTTLDPTEVVQLLNNYLEVMTRVILKKGGTIDEFIGDAILVLFGAPIETADHAWRAVSCAVDMQKAMVEVNRKNEEMGLPRIEMGIGINSGEVVVGSIGSEQRLKYAVVGTAVNLTARIESYTEGGQILISSDTFAQVESNIVVGESREVIPKGWSEPVEIFEVLDMQEQADIEKVRIAE